MEARERHDRSVWGPAGFGGVLFAVVSAAAAELLFFNFSFSGHIGPAIGRTAVVFFSLFILHRTALVSFPAYRPERKDLVTLTGIVLGVIGIVWVGRLLGISLAAYGGKSQFLRGIEPDAFYFAIPFACGALVLQAIKGLHFAIVCSLATTLLVFVYFPGEPFLGLYTLATTLVACLSFPRFRSRSAFIRAGLNISLAAIPFALATIISETEPRWVDIVVTLAGAVVSGVVCSFIASGVTPIVEYLGGYVTDMRLIEMATLDHPLLKELSIQAPGTWNHSMVMGMMAESAAVAIGANPVVARVGAYFHDIGKMTKPLYFAENQGSGENRHDRLSTSMSALIIRSHVKDGVELARRHKLPRVIEDLIPQHHGTSRIDYFYEKACREAKESGGDSEEVDPNLYSYPGPKPQSKEAAILMLADGIEAAARTVNEPSLDRIQGLVQKMINKVFASGQLDECEVTLKDLHEIAKCFTRVLNGIYHQRIAYAEPAEKIHERPKGEESRSTGGADGGAGVEHSRLNEKTASTDHHGEGQKSRPEDLKRLGI